MTVHDDLIDPADMTADGRLAEVAAILAAAVLRLRDRAAVSGGESAVRFSADSGQIGLEVPAEMRLHGARG